MKGNTANQFPLVSICSTTYNLEKYITQAIESWLNQKTDFEYEIVISDDGSTDRTKEIIQEYIQKYPGKIRLISNAKNLGMLPNFIQSLKEAKGKYIAVCDGDDYWIDANKLQKQLDFLEKNPDFSTCYTNTILVDENSQTLNVAKHNIWDVAETKDLLLHDDFMEGDNIHLSPGHISGFVFRNFLIKSFPAWFYKCDNVTDFPLYMMLSKYGKAKFINENMSAYRIHAKNVSTLEFEKYRHHRGRIFMYRKVNAFLGYKHRKWINNAICKHCLELLYQNVEDKNKFKAVFNLIKAFWYSPGLTIKTLRKK